MSKRVVIVGAGPGGLATAMLLARAGASVDVLEQRSVVGGRTSRLDMDGYCFDIGPTFFLYPSVLEEIFRYCGFELTDEVPMVRLDPHYRVLFEGGGRMDATPDVARMKEQIASLRPGDAAGLEPFLADNRKKLRSFEAIFHRPFLHAWDMLRPSVLKSLRHLSPHRSLEQEVGRYFQDPRVRLAFTFQSKYLGMSPFHCPSLFSILSFLEYEFGVFHPVGGCGQLTRVMGRLAEALGARIHLDEAAEEVLFDGGRASGVRTAGGAYVADAVVVNADFAEAMRRLVPERRRRRWSDARIATRKYSCSTFMMYLGVRGGVDLPHHTIWLAADYPKNLKEIEDLHVLSGNPSFYVQNACVSDRCLAPAGGSTLYVLVPVTHQHAHVDWAAHGAAFRRTVLGQLEKIGVEHLEDRIVSERVVTPDDWAEQHAIYRGATFNLAHSLDQMLYFRPHNRFEDARGVYLVGGGTHPGSGLPVIFASAGITTRLVCRQLGLPEPAVGRIQLDAGPVSERAAAPHGERG